MANLEIGIGADASEFNSEISKVEKQLQTLERRQEIRVRAGLDTGDLNRRITEARSNLERLRTSMTQAGQAANNFQRPVGNAGNTLTQFSRIAQDAPFGIIGIGNNLTATAESFAHLSNQAGGAGNALRAVAGSIMGTGGILLAISLVTTGLTLMAQKGLTVGDMIDKLTGNFDKYKNSLADVNKEAAKNSAVEIQSIKNYVAVAQDRTLADDKRLIAVKKLQDNWPAYFGILTKEQILNGNIKKAVDGVTNAILAKARAQAASAKLGELAVKEFELTEKQAKLQEQVNKATAKTNDLLTQIGKNPANEQLANRWARAGREAEGFRDDLKDVTKELSGVTAEMTKLSKASEEAFKKGIETEAEAVKVVKPKKPKKQPKPKIDRSFFFDLEEMAAEMQRAKELILAEPIELPFIIPAPDEQFKSMIERIKALNENLKSVIDSGLTDAFSGIGEAIGAAFASGGNVIEAVGKSLLSSVGSILVELGKMAIATGVGILGIKTALKTLNPAVAIAAGVALVAIGGAVSAKSSSLGNSMGGVGGAVSAGNSVSSPTSSVSGGGSFSSGYQNVVFEISGQSLVGVLSNTLNKNVKLGGTPAI